MPSFRIALAMEKRKSGNHFALLQIRKKEKKDFDDMFDTPKLYISASCSNSCQLVPLHPIYRHVDSVSSLQRAEGICIKQVEQIEARVNRSN
jgi:hypothetical protein